MDTRERYSRDDLLDAWLKHDATRGSHPDLADYYYRQVWALARAHDGWGPGVSFSTVPREHAQLWTVFHDALAGYNSAHGPWGYFLAGKPEPQRAAVEAQHGPPIAKACAQLQAAYRALLLDLLERIWDVGPNWTASLEKVRQHGFDPDTPEPNSDRYW